MKFSEGDQVLARNPNSSEFEKATVASTKGNKYTIEFKGGVKHSLSASDVKAQRASRSQSRSRSRATAKSPARNSPSRKSPARKSPARSPAKTQSRKLPVRSAAKQAKVTLARLDMAKDTSSDTEEGSDESEPQVKSQLRNLGRITRRSIRIASSASKAEQDQKLMNLRSGDRAASLPIERKTQYNASEGKGRGASAQRDENLMKLMNYDDDTEAELELEGKSKKKKPDLSRPQEFGGWFAVLLVMLTAPPVLILMQLACTNDICSSKNLRILRLKELKQWRSFLNPEAMLFYAGFMTFICIMSILPIGRLHSGQQSRVGRFQYRINGFWTLLISVVVFGGLTYQGYPISEFLLKKSLPMTIAGLTYGLLLTVILYIKGGRVSISALNIYGSTTSKIYNFWQGREINPRFGPLDVKMCLYRFGLIVPILINVAAIFKVIKDSPTLDLNNLNVAAIALASIQIVYLSSALVFESSALTTFEFMYEGTGYMLSVGYFIYPSLATIGTRYLILNRVNLPLYVLIPIVLIFFAALVIRSKCDNQKDEFRRNPFAPSLSHLETIPTKHGKRLIVSGYWGYVRHPNYLCDIVMHLCFSALSYSLDIFPHILTIMTIILLVHRAIRDNGRCAKRYGYAWQQYRSRVKYMILKGVF